MITPDECVTKVAKYLDKNTSIKVFKYDDKPSSYKGEYIAVNNLPFTYGKYLNNNNALNINVHVPQRSQGGTNRPRLTELTNLILQLIPYDTGVEESKIVNIDGIGCYTEMVTQELKDTDNTYFINIRVKIIF